MACKFVSGSLLLQSFFLFCMDCNKVYFQPQFFFCLFQMNSGCIGSISFVFLWTADLVTYNFFSA